MIIRMRLRAGAAIPGRLSTHPLCPRSPGTGPSEQSTTQQQRRTRLPPAAPTTKSPAQDGISIESHPRSSTEPHKSPAVEYWLLDHPRMELFYLPPYAPELNPDELLNQDVHTHVARRRPSNLAKLVTLTVEYLATRTSEIVSKYFDGEYVAYAK